MFGFTSLISQLDTLKGLAFSQVGVLKIVLSVTTRVVKKKIISL